MVQVIQAGPTSATIRQQALNDASNTILGGLDAYQKRQDTLRQQALQDQAIQKQQQQADLDTNLKLASMGIDANAKDLKDFAAGTYQPKLISAAQDAKPAEYGSKLQGPVQPGAKGLGVLLVGSQDATPQDPNNIAVPAQDAKAAVYGNANPMLNYTEAKKAQMARDVAAANLKQDETKSQINKNNSAADASSANAKFTREIKPQLVASQVTKNENAAASADSKQDEKTNKRFSDFAKNISNPTTRNALGNFGKNLAAADRIKVLTDSYTNGAKPGSPEEINALNQLSSQQSEEVTKSLDSLLSGGASTISGADHLRFQTLASQWSDLKAKYGNKPQGAELGAFLSRALETVSRERDYNAKQVDRILGGLGEGYSDLRKKDSGRFQNILNSAYDKGETSPPQSSGPVASAGGAPWLKYGGKK